MTVMMSCQCSITSSKRARRLGDGKEHGKTEILPSAHVSSRKATKKGYKSIQGRFLRCPVYRQSKLNIGWTVQDCLLVLNSSGPNGPMNQREDYEEAKKILSTSKSRIWLSSAQTSSSRRSWITTRPTICLARRRFRARRPEDRPEVVRHSANTELRFFRMATVCVVAIFFVVTDIKVVRSRIFLNTSQGVSLTGNGDYFVSDRMCKRYTEPALDTSGQVNFFSRGSRPFEALCLSQKRFIFTT